MFIRGKIQYDETRGTKLLVDELRHPDQNELAEKLLKLYIKLPSQQSSKMQYVLDLLKAYPGVNECILYFADTKKSVSTLNRFGVDIHPNLISELKKAVGDAEIVVK